MKKHGVNLHQVDPGSVLRDCELRACGKAGLRIYGEPRYGDAVIAQVERVRSQGNRVGVQLDGGGPVSLVGCRVEGNREAGVRVAANDGRPGRVRLERCVVTGNGSGGAGPDLARVEDGSLIERVETDVPADRQAVVAPDDD